MWQIEGIIPLGTSLDYESERSRKLGCGDGVAACTGPIEQWTTTQTTSDFEPDDGFCNFLIDVGFGKNCDNSVRDFWRKTIKGNYQGGTHHLNSRLSFKESHCFRDTLRRLICV